MKIKFKVDTDRLTFGDLLDMESAKLQAMAAVMVRCMVDDGENYLPEEEARKILRAIPLDELKDTADQFGKAMESFKNQATPTTGGVKL